MKKIEKYLTSVSCSFLNSKQEMKLTGTMFPFELSDLILLCESNNCLITVSKGIVHIRKISKEKFPNQNLTKPF